MPAGLRELRAKAWLEGCQLGPCRYVLGGVCWVVACWALVMQHEAAAKVAEVGVLLRPELHAAQVEVSVPGRLLGVGVEPRPGPACGPRCWGWGCLQHSHLRHACKQTHADGRGCVLRCVPGEGGRGRRDSPGRPWLPAACLCWNQ